MSPQLAQSFLQREIEQIKELFRGCEDCIMKAAQDLVKVKNRFGPGIEIQVETDLEEHLKDLIFMDHQLYNDMKANSNSIAEVSNKVIEIEKIVAQIDEIDEQEDKEEAERRSSNWYSELDHEESSLQNRNLSSSNTRKKNKTRNKKDALVDTMLNGVEFLFEQQAARFKKPSQKRFKNDSRLKKFKHILRAPGDGESEEEEIEAASVENIPIDPYTNKEIEIPVRNKTCGHIYDKKGIMAYIHSKANPRCPAIGCSNRRLAAHDLQDDESMRIRIERLKCLRDESDDDEEENRNEEANSDAE